MKLLFLSAFLLVFCFSETKAQNFGVRNITMCDVFGGVFVTKDPSKAQLHVYLEESEAFCDLPVFQAASVLYADRSGLWFFTDNISEAKFIVYFQKKRNLANFSIAYIENESFAGCR